MEEREGREMVWLLVGLFILGGLFLIAGYSFQGTRRRNFWLATAVIWFALLILGGTTL
jgi:hypothetical protein